MPCLRLVGQPHGGFADNASRVHGLAQRFEFAERLSRFRCRELVGHSHVIGIVRGLVDRFRQNTVGFLYGRKRVIRLAPVPCSRKPRASRTKSSCHPPIWHLQILLLLEPQCWPMATALRAGR